MTRILLIACLMVPGALTFAPLSASAAQSCPQAFLEHQLDRVVEFKTDTVVAALPTMDFPTEPENLAQFVVDTLGRPDSASLKFLRVTDQSLPNAVARVIKSWRFTPATAKGRKVCQLLQTPVAYQHRPKG